MRPGASRPGGRQQRGQHALGGPLARPERELDERERPAGMAERHVRRQDDEEVELARALADHVEAVDDELVRHRGLAIAYVNGRLGGIVVDARSRSAAGAARLAASHRAQPGHAGSHRHERDITVAGQRQRR